MERIVNGHYADPNSTRDIIGITPGEFEVLIDILRLKLTEIHTLFEMGDEGFKQMIFNNANLLFGEEEGADVKENYREVITATKEMMEKQYSILIDFIEALNQPYPGALYLPPDLE